MVDEKQGWQGWFRAIILVDMNAFFASIEQLDNAALRGRPVVVTNGEQGTCIITSSYEARRYGIKTGMRLPEAKRLCPHLVRAPSRPGRYAKVSSRIMEALRDVTPDQEIFSVDECFLDISHCRTLYATPVDAAHKAKQCVLKASGLLCSVGLGGDKTMAKFAAQATKARWFDGDSAMAVSATFGARTSASIVWYWACDHRFFGASWRSLLW